MANYVIQRPESVGYWSTTASAYSVMTSASALDACGTASGFCSLGSVREFTFETTSETLYATATVLNDAKVASLTSGYEGTITMLCEEITSSAMKLAMGNTASGTDYWNDASATSPTNYTIVAGPFWIDGSAYTLVATKCHIMPGAVRKLSKEQELIEIKASVLVDPDASGHKQWFRLLKQ